jgi:hypothetical protein
VEECLNLLALVPPGAIDVEPDRVPAESPVQVAARLEEPRPIAVRQRHHVAPVEARGHPTAEIEAGVVLTGRGDPDALAAPPRAPEPRMEREAGLIGESDGLGRSQSLEFS